MRYVGKTVGAIGRDRVGSRGGRQPILRRRANRAEHRCATALVVRNQHESACAVGRKENRDMRLGCGSEDDEPAGSLIDPKTGDRRADTLADIEHLAVGANRHHRRAAGGWYLALLSEFTGFVDREGRIPVRLLQRDIERAWHRTSP